MLSPCSVMVTTNDGKEQYDLLNTGYVYRGRTRLYLASDSQIPLLTLGVVNNTGIIAAEVGAQAGVANTVY